MESKKENKKRELTLVQRWAANAVKCGPMPQHVAIIMDGNRRFAKEQGIEKFKAYELGTEKLLDVASWFPDLGIKEVSVYAFSIENFKRPKEEVDFLMHLFKRQTENLYEDRDKLAKEGIRIHFQGDLTFLPVGNQIAAAKLEMATRHNKKAQLNMCIAYTSRYELSTVANKLKRVTNQAIIDEHSVDINCIDSIIGAGFCGPTEPDIYIRTSGEVRLSDYLLWQSGNSILHNIDIKWPEFNFWHLIKAILHYQANFRNRSRAIEYERQMIKNESGIMKQILEQLKHLVIEEQEKLLKDLQSDDWNQQKELPPSETTEE